MSRTLFWYVFKDLLRIFWLASGALAGIMSFGGLLRPLTEHGLNAAQVSRMLAYFGPAMTTYSFPIAALFATTMVYGRLSSDNELTACRACGISYLSLTAPALVLGLTVAMVSLLFLCFIVPVYTLKVEQVVYSNLAQLIENEIDRKHQISLDELNIYAQSARVLDNDPRFPNAQRVELIGPMIVSYTVIEDANKQHLRVPSEFSMAAKAVAYIEQRGDEVSLWTWLYNGSHFPRDIRTGPHVVVHSSQAGPFPFPSPIREDPKFMILARLKYLFQNPEKSRRLADLIKQLIREEQQDTYLDTVADKLNDAETGHSFVFESEGEKLMLHRGDMEVITGDHELIIKSRNEEHQVRLELSRNGQVVSTEAAAEVHLAVEPEPAADEMADITPQEEGGKARATTRPIPPTASDSEDDAATIAAVRNTRFAVVANGYDVLIDAGDVPAAHKKFRRELDIPMPDELQKFDQHTAQHFLDMRGTDRDSLSHKLRDETAKLRRKLQSEIHSRASFSISCLVLVMVGCALGMMFRSGNFLSAFSLSAVPAMMCIALVVTGQQLCSNITLPVNLGLSVIWSGNAIVLVLAIVLLGRLQVR